MSGRSRLKLDAEQIIASGHGWDLDPATHRGAHHAYREAFGAAAAQVSGGNRVGSGNGRGPMIVDGFRPYGDGFQFLSVKGHKPWPSKSVITTGKGAECLEGAAMMGLDVPCVSMAFFDSGRVSVRVYDLAGLIREHGIIDKPEGGFGRGKAPPIYRAETSRPSGVKTASKLLKAGAIDPEDFKGVSTLTYKRLEMSFAALGWSKGRGWTHIEGCADGSPDTARILDTIEGLYDWDAANCHRIIIG